MSYKKYLAIYKKCLSIVLVLGLSFSLFTGCGSTSSKSFKGKNTSVVTDVTDLSAYEDNLDTDNMFTERDIDASYDDSTAKSVALTDETITITEAGTYILSGTISDGQIIVDAPSEKVQLVLNDVSITSSSSAAIYVKNAKKVFLTMAEGTTNTLTTSGDYAAIDDNNIDGVIFSKSNLTLNGVGTLIINGTSAHGIVSKDDLIITSGTFEINAASHALSGKDSVKILDGTFKLTAGKDAVHSSGNSSDSSSDSNSTGASDSTSVSDPTDGFVYIAGGTFEISCGDDGIHAEGALHIDNGSIHIAKCYEGLEGLTITVNDGDIEIVASDDGLNAGNGTSGDQGKMTSPDNNQNGNMTPPDNNQNGNMTPPDNNQNGNMTPPDNNQGERPTPPSGDDESHKGMGHDGEMNHDNGMGHGGGMDYCSDNWIIINNGSIQITATGDGIDSNGNLLITGGDIRISTRESGPDSAIDFSGEAAITGGTVIATGSSEMAERFSEKSTQGSIQKKFDTACTGDISVADSAGNILGTFTPVNGYNCVFVSFPEMTSGNTYSLSYGTTSQEITLSSLVTNE